MSSAFIIDFDDFELFISFDIFAFCHLRVTFWRLNLFIIVICSRFFLFMEIIKCLVLPIFVHIETQFILSSKGNNRTRNEW